MERSHAVLPRRERRSDIGGDALRASGPIGGRTGRRRIPYGLGLLFLALIAGLAAALVLTIGNAHAVVRLLGAGAGF